MTPEAAERIFIHYFRALARRSGLRWTEANSADIRSAVAALIETGDDTIPALCVSDEEAPPPARPAPPPARQPEPEPERVTVNLERQDPRFADWKAQRDTRERESVSRMLSHQDAER